MRAKPFARQVLGYIARTEPPFQTLDERVPRQGRLHWLRSALAFIPSNQPAEHVNINQFSGRLRPTSDRRGRRGRRGSAVAITNVLSGGVITGSVTQTAHVKGVDFDKLPLSEADHPDTRAAQTKLAAQAFLAAVERILGPDYADTLTARIALASAYQSAGDLQQALSLYQAVLADAQQNLGPDHPITRAVRDELAHAREAEA